MQFLFPTFLWALLALAIPIIIHLFYFRRFKKVYFTNIRFLREVKEETSSRSKLRNLLVLLMRCLAIAALVFAFAQPFLPQDEVVKAGKKSVSVYVDNSFSMSANSEEVPLLDKAKDRAREIISAYAVDDEFQVLTNDFEGRHQRLVSREDALALIDEVKVSPAVRPLSSVLSRQKQALTTGTAEESIGYLISDFQKTTSDFAQVEADSTLKVNMVPMISVNERNIAIDTAYFTSPVQLLNQPNEMLVKVRNLSDEDAQQIRLNVRYGGQTRPVGVLTIPAGGVVTDTVNLTVSSPGTHQVELAITDYPVQFDDTYYLTFAVAQHIDVLVIYDEAPNDFLDRAYSGAGYFRVRQQSALNLDYTELSNYQLIILDDLKNITTGLASALKKYTGEGGNTLVFPGRQAVLQTYSSFLGSFPANELTSWESRQRQVGRINREEFIFSDVFEGESTNFRLPTTQGNFGITQYGGRGEERLLIYRDGTPYLTKYQYGSGRLYLCVAPLDPEFNNLIRQGEIFVPMLFKIAISSSRNRSAASIISQDETLQARHNPQVSTDQVYKLRGPSGEFIPEQRVVGTQVYLGPRDQVQQAGFYDLYLEKDNVLDQFAFNYDRKESDLSYYNTDDLVTEAPQGFNVLEVRSAEVLTAQIAQRSRGIPLWRWFLIAALVFLLIEVLLLRFWRN